MKPTIYIRYPKEIKFYLLEGLKTRFLNSKLCMAQLTFPLIAVS